MKKTTILMLGIASGVAVWAITKYLEQFEKTPEAQEKSTLFFNKVKNRFQADKIKERGSAL